MQATLIKYGLTDLIAPQRILYPDASDAVKMLGKPTSSAVYQPWSIIQIVELTACLPLNLIPWVGTPAFIIITGTRLGKLSHYRWFQVKGFSKDQRKKEVRDRAWEYVWFGTVTMLLELIPVLSLFFLMTSTAAAAMWAARIEEDRRREVVQDLVGEDVPPPYSDSAV